MQARLPSRPYPSDQPGGTAPAGIAHRAGPSGLRPPTFRRQSLTWSSLPSYSNCQKFFPAPLTLTLSPRRGARGKGEETFGKPYKTSGKVSLTGHSEGAKRPKNLITTRKYEILGGAQDDNMEFCRGLELLPKSCLGEPQALACAKEPSISLSFPGPPGLGAPRGLSVRRQVNFPHGCLPRFFLNR
jgi:hypothetical protein